MKNRLSGNFWETLCVAALLLLFGVTTYTLVAVGGQSFDKILQKRDVSSNLRVAVSFMANHIRQNDLTGGVELRDGAQGYLLVLSQDYGGERYDTIIYQHDGKLMEALLSAEQAFDPRMGDELVPLTGMALSYAGPAENPTSALKLTVWDGEGEARREETLVIKLRAA